MPFDPYFTATGPQKFTCLGQPRAVYSTVELSQVDRLLKLPDKQRTTLACQLWDKRVAHQNLTRIELRFLETMRRRSRARRFMSLHAIMDTPKNMNPL